MPAGRSFGIQEIRFVSVTVLPPIRPPRLHRDLRQGRVCQTRSSGLTTTHAQRPGPSTPACAIAWQAKDVWIATTARWVDSLQRWLGIILRTLHLKARY